MFRSPHRGTFEKSIKCLDHLAWAAADPDRGVGRVVGTRVVFQGTLLEAADAEISAGELDGDRLLRLGSEEGTVGIVVQ